MRNPIQEKITNIKFSIKRIATECETQDMTQTRLLLEEANEIIDKAIQSTDFVLSRVNPREE